MSGVLAATWAELIQLKTIGGIATILLGDISAFFAYGASQRNLRTNVGSFLGHVAFSFCDCTCSIHIQFSHVRFVAGAGLEPATQRL